MKRELLMMLAASMLVCGCAARMDSDLLQARIREQSVQLTESQREIAKTRLELKRSRSEAERLKSELAQAGQPVSAGVPMSRTVSRLRINSLSSGGLNKDDQPGDDVVVVQFVPLDSDNEVVRVPGEVELTLLDPLLLESEREIGKWNFTEEECGKHWTRGITSSGYQFSLPLDRSPQHTDLIVHAQYRTSDDCRLEISHVVKVTIPEVVGIPARAALPNRRIRPNPVLAVEESEEILPPLNERPDAADDIDKADWAVEESNSVPLKSGKVILHSSSWTDATIPQTR